MLTRDVVMAIYDTGYDLLSPAYIRNTEQILKELALSEHRIVTASLHKKPVYLIIDLQLAKHIFEDGRNFSFAPGGVSEDGALTDGTRAFIDEGLESSLLSASYDDYKFTRRLFNQAFKQGYSDCAEALDTRAKQQVTELLEHVEPPAIDALDLCRRYWMPLIATVIGIDSLPFSDLSLVAQCARTLVEGNGLQGDRDAITRLTQANETIVELIERVATTQDVPPNSALGYFLGQMDIKAAIDITRTFILGGIDTGSSALALQTHLLASDAQQRARFLAMSQSEQQSAMTELAAKEAPTYYTPRFAVRDVRIDDIDIPAGAFLQLAVYGMNNCANPDFDIRRSDKAACPMHNNESLPFGHARHKCPGEVLARHLMPIFLNGLFDRFDVTAIQSCRKEPNTFARSITELILNVEARR